MADPYSNRLRPDERYQRDEHFRALVDLMTNAIASAQYTPTEMREAALLAAIHYEMNRKTPGWRIEFKPIDPTTERVDLPPMSEADIARFMDAMGIERGRRG